MTKLMLIAMTVLALAGCTRYSSTQSKPGGYFTGAGSP